MTALVSVVLPLPFGPDQAEDLAAPDLQVDAGQRDQPAEAALDLATFQHRRVGACAGLCHRFSSSSLMITLRTSVVPAPISSSLIARYSRFTSDSQM